MSEYERLKAEFDRVKAKQDGKIASEALQEAYDKMKTNRDMFKGVNPPSHYYENGYREGLDAAMRIVGEMIDARKNS